MNNIGKKLAIVILMFLVNANSATYINGVINKDTELRKEFSPYIVTGDILIKSDAVLRIEPGVVIKIMDKDTTKSDILQIDKSDSMLISIKVYGGLICGGNKDNRVEFISNNDKNPNDICWYGIVLNNINLNYAELCFVNVSSAVYGFKITKCKPEIFNCIFSHNNTGIYCDIGANATIRNNTIVNNLVADIFVRGSNPIITCNILAFNRNNSVWSDGTSKLSMSFNCVYGAGDGNFVDCPVDIGKFKRVNTKGDSCDKWFNIFKDPVFAGSTADSAAIEKDITLPTDASKMKDTVLAKAATKKLSDNQAKRVRLQKYPPYTLSTYSPCKDAGKSSSKYNDNDGTTNDLGAYGGPGVKIE